ncbi:MAG: xanthine phosphoribosyltransferase [Oscillospiraceae bacterium]|nr:xanthine phosphoribosyltransferase [Oscillospiraceae bacterium]
MKLLEERILSEGKVLPGGILKVGSFLNQQIDTELLSQMAAECARLFDGAGVNKVLTIESSGIAFATAAAMALRVPMVFAKKHRSSNVDGLVCSVAIRSYTRGTEYNALVSRDYLGAGDRVLIADDFLASSSAVRGLISLIKQSGAELVGVCCAVEKGFQGGGDRLRAAGVRVESLAIIEEMTEKQIIFRTEERAQ